MPKITAGTLVRIHGRVPWLTHFNRSTGEWLGVCIPLNLNASGETFQEMQSIAYEAMSLLFDDLVETGEFDAFLRANSWRSEQLPRPGSPARFDVASSWDEGQLPMMMGV